MNLMRSKKGISLIETMFPVLVVWIVPMLFVGWTDRSVDYILTLIKGVPVDVTLGLSVALTIIFSWSIMMFNVVVELIRYAI